MGLASGQKRLWAGAGRLERLKEEALRIGFMVFCIEMNEITRNTKSEMLSVRVTRSCGKAAYGKIHVKQETG